MIFADAGTGSQNVAHVPLQFDFFGFEGDDRDPQAVGQLDHFLLVQEDGHFAFDREDPAAGLAHRLDRVDADRRHVEPHVLLRLGNLDDGEAAAAAQGPRSPDGRVGPLNGFQRDDRHVVDDDRLTDVETAKLFGNLPTEADVAPL